MRIRILLPLFILSIVGCEKKQCYQCTNYSSEKWGSGPRTTDTTQYSVCDMTKKEKEDFENSQYKNRTVDQNGIMVNYTTVVNCQ